MTDRERDTLADRLTKAYAFAETIRPMTGPRIIEYATNVLFVGKGDLATLSGLSAAQIAALSKGKRPSAAERAALCWAAAQRL